MYLTFTKTCETMLKKVPKFGINDNSITLQFVSVLQRISFYFRSPCKIKNGFYYIRKKRKQIEKKKQFSLYFSKYYFWNMFLFVLVRSQKHQLYKKGNGRSLYSTFEVLCIHATYLMMLPLTNNL